MSYIQYHDGLFLSRKCAELERGGVCDYTDSEEISMKKKSIKEVAELAHVSIGTVDRVLHNRGRVAAKTEEKIRRIIEEFDYKPNVFASALKTGKIFRFGVLMPRPGLFCEYWELPLNGIRKAARELAHHILIDYFFFDVANGAASFAEASKNLLGAGLDGFIICLLYTSDAADE